MKITLTKIVLFVLVSLSVISCSKEDAPSTTENIAVDVRYSYNTDETDVLTLINNHRQNIGLSKLEKIDFVSVKSEEHTNYMISTGSVNHNFFQDRYESIMKALSAKNVSENLAYNYLSAQSVFNAWLNSPGHRANIEGDFTHFGISIRTSTDGKKYFTNIFVKK